ncbi:hypothetical protein HYW19_00055 [Candidatus Woesearchaeota archaeon]|nr:hypothetical protein [Candidatus Woesearchaeota archaeon]
MPAQATIRTYATSANLGPLFDRAGAKIEGLYMTTHGKLIAAHGLRIAKSDGNYPVPTNASNTIYKVAEKIFHDFKIRKGLQLSVTNNVKPGGLGISGAGAVAVVELLNYVHNLNLTAEQKIKYASLGEPSQHLDNVVPCIIGGIVLISWKGNQNAYEKLDSLSGITPAIVMPYDIIKSGGTAHARKVLECMDFNEEDEKYKSKLASLMISGLRAGSFGKIFEAIKKDNSWQKSVTFVRNMAGIYGIDINYLNSRLEAVVGEEAVLTPSGAGPAMLILAKNHKAAEKAVKAVTQTYASLGKKAEGFVTSFRNAASEDGFV